MKNFEKIDILGAKVANLTIDEIVDILIENIKTKSTTSVFTPNSEIIYNFHKNTELMNILNSADILSADGIGVVMAAKILKTPLKGRAAGFDIATALIARAVSENFSFFFFGGKEGVAELAKANLLEKYPSIKISGTQNGYSIDGAVENIRKSNADVVFVCLGAEKQERWIYENKDKLAGKIFLGIGGSLDVFAGTAKRAPNIFIKLNLEWFYRLLKQPSRFVRMLALPKFIIKVALCDRKL